MRLGKKHRFWMDIIYSFRDDIPTVALSYQDNGKPHENAGRKATGHTQNDIRSIYSLLILFRILYLRFRIFRFTWIVSRQGYQTMNIFLSKAI